ncbi:MAG: hypothetical protein RSA87_01405 [Malacoplasma sp.]
MSMNKKPSIANVVTNIISKFIENDYKLSTIHKILKEVDEQDEKMRFIEKYDSSKDKILDISSEIHAFILSREKKINLFEIDKINLFIFIINEANISKTNEFKCIEFCQNKVSDWSNCDYFIIFLNQKANLVKRVNFNGITTFINLV